MEIGKFPYKPNESYKTEMRRYTIHIKLNYTKENCKCFICGFFCCIGHKQCNIEKESEMCRLFRAYFFLLFFHFYSQFMVQNEKKILMKL